MKSIKFWLFGSLVLILLGVVAYLIYPAFYPDLPFQSLSKREVLQKIRSTDQPIVQLTQEKSATWYISHSDQGKAKDYLREWMGEKGWEFEYQDGAGYFFSNDQEEKLIITSQMWTGSYVLFKVPTLDKKVEGDNPSKTVEINSKLDQEEAKQIILTALHKLYRETDFSLSFEELKPELSSYFSENLIDGLLKEFLKAAYYGTDWVVLGSVGEQELNLRFQWIEREADKVVVETVQFANELLEASYVDYTLIKQQDTWLMDKVEFKYRTNSDKPIQFNLQVNEAEGYLHYYYAYYLQREVEVIYIETQEGKQGRYHLFQVLGENIDTKLAMYTHDGYIADLSWYPEADL